MISDDADQMTDFLVGASVAFGRSGSLDFHEKLGEAVAELHNYIADLEAENAALKERIAVYDIGIDPKIHPKPDTWVLMMDCDDDYFPVQFDPAMKRYWNYAESGNNMNFWNDSDEDLSKWFPLPGKKGGGE